MRSIPAAQHIHCFQVSLPGDTMQWCCRESHSLLAFPAVNMAAPDPENKKYAIFIPCCQSSDERLWVDCRQGDKEAFAILYYRHFKNLIQSGITISDNRELVKDCMHDLFMEIWKNKERLSIPQSVKAYLVRSVQRKILRQVKRTRSYYRKCTIAHNDDGGIVHSIEKKIISEQLRQEQKNDVRKAVQNLSRREQEAVYLKFYADLSYTEIAGRMAISIHAIYNLISKAIYNMQQHLSKTPLHTF